MGADRHLEGLLSLVVNSEREGEGEGVAAGNAPGTVIQSLSTADELVG